MANIIVLGAGLVGGVMAKDLAKQHNVTSVDISQKNLDKLEGINTICADVSNRETLQNLIKDFDLVVGALPGFMGYKMMKDVIEAGKNIVDISFYPEDPFGLDELAKEKGVVAVMDCGVAPGMGNIIFGHHDKSMKITDYECLVGGLPEKREWPYEYQAVFSPIDVIEEYIRPARYVQHSQLITKEALSDTELIEFDEIGTLESWNSDGLRSLIKTMAHVPNMIEKTLRYPGHVEYVKVLKESGFFSEEKVSIRGAEISPLDFTSKILFNEWKLGDTEEEITVMRITLKGENLAGKIEEVVYTLHDQYCRETNTSSMARTTGYTAAAAANILLENKFSEKGVFPPELIGKHEVCFYYFLSYLEQRNIIYQKKSKILE